MFYALHQYLIELSYCVYSHPTSTFSDSGPILIEIPSSPSQVKYTSDVLPAVFFFFFLFEKHITFKKEYNLCWILIMQVVVFGPITYTKAKHDISNANDYDSV